MDFVLATCIGSALFFIVLERVFPARQLPESPYWWLRIAIINTVQAVIVVTGGYTWESYLKQHSLFSISSIIPSNIFGGLLGYFAITFVFYWWHLARHKSDFLWRTFHQAHHSVNRIETLTSFYKHPLEIIVNSILMSFCCYILLGLNVTQTAWATIFSAVGEYIYHANIRTPRALGYFFQRPEMHRVHHKTGYHHSNYSDLPIWDMLFKTYSNPSNDIQNCGFTNNKELEIKSILFGKDLHS